MKFEVKPRMASGKVIVDVEASDGEGEHAMKAVIGTATCDTGLSAYSGAHELVAGLQQALTTAYELGSLNEMGVARLEEIKAGSNLHAREAFNRNR